MKSHLALRAVALAAAGSALLGGCGDALSADGGGNAGDGTTVTVAISANIFDMPLHVAQANGYFKKQGLTVKFVTITASTGPATLDSGSAQFLHESPTGFFSAIGKGLPQTAIAGDAGGNPLGLVVSTKFAKAHGLTAATPADQVAKALAKSTGGASSANTKAEAGLYLKQYGVDPTKLKWVTLPSPAADKAALNNDQIDWFVTSEPIPLQIQYEGDGVVVADPVKVPLWSSKSAGYGQFLVAKPDYLKAHGDTTKKFTAALEEGLKYLSGHPGDESVLAAARKAMPGVPDGALRDSIKQVEWPPTGAMTEAELATTAAFITSLGALKQEVKLTSQNWTNKYLP